MTANDSSAFTVSANSNGFAWGKPYAPTLDLTGGMMPNQQYGVRMGTVVRRLTPVEAERLQGFPDNWTRIAYRNKSEADCPDGPRYKAIGNSMATVCMAWVGFRIAQALGHDIPFDSVPAVPSEKNRI